MSDPKSVAILGAGFSGLTLARELNRRGLRVEVFEKAPRLGGLIQTSLEPVLCESAAHAILASQEVENLFQELALEMLLAKKESKAKWIFRGRPRNWPLKISEILRTAAALAGSRIQNELRPKPFETIQVWCERVATPEVAHYLLGPALQGVYATQPDRLSASLIIGGMFSQETKIVRGLQRGSVAPPRGMFQLIEAMAADLQNKNVPIRFSQTVSLPDLQSRFSAVVVATSMPAAGELLLSSCPMFSRELKKLPMLSVSSATVGFAEGHAKRLRGFGCLFPKPEGYESLGVLFNTDIFEQRGEGVSETWILPSDYPQLSEAEVLELILRDRQRLGLMQARPLSCQIHRWPQGLPLYGVELEAFLARGHFDGPAFVTGAKLRESETPLFLTGNYLGGIGLTKILSYNRRLADRIRRELTHP
jgi:protoporphyrinogen/coproporphyrinogen III oxidase